jgi:hypothetical protein
MGTDTLDSDFAEELISICRTTVGDELRSIAYFTDEDVEPVYLRDDLDRTADLVGFATHERLGFHDQSAYQDTQLGEYQATVRMFEDGYLTRVIYGQTGVWVTTDEMSIDRFEELVTALKTVLTNVEPTDNGLGDDEDDD